MEHDCHVCSVVRLSSACREVVLICRSPSSPAFSWRVWRPLSERGPAPVFPSQTGQEGTTHILFGISMLRLIKEGSGCASARLRNCRRLCDAGVLPVPTTGQPQRDQDEKLPVRSNAQVPANWAFLQILAQSPFSLLPRRLRQDHPCTTSQARRRTAVASAAALNHQSQARGQN